MKKIILLTLAVLIVQFPVLAIESNSIPWEVKINKNKKEQEKIFVLNPFWESYNDELLNGYI